MAVRKLRPTTPGQRHKIIGTFETITSNVPEKSLLEPIKKSGGRNNTGKMTMRYIGGGHKRKYRVIDFKRNKDGVPATVESIQYDPNRSARIALLVYSDGEKRYILAPNGLQVGQNVNSGTGIAPEIGVCPYGIRSTGCKTSAGGGQPLVLGAYRVEHDPEIGVLAIGQPRIPLF